MGYPDCIIVSNLAWSCGGMRKAGRGDPEGEGAGAGGWGGEGEKALERVGKRRLLIEAEDSVGPKASSSSGLMNAKRISLKKDLKLSKAYVTKLILVSDMLIIKIITYSSELMGLSTTTSSSPL